MGLAVGLAWIIIGVCYMVYKYCNEDLRMSTTKSLGIIVLGFVIFFMLGGLASGIQWLEDNTPILWLIITTPIAIGGCVLVGWLVAGDVKDAIKDKPATGDITQGINGEITQGRLYMLQQQPPAEDMEYLSKIRTIQKKWFEANDVYISFGEAVAQLRSMGGKVTIDPSVRWQGQKPKSFSASCESIEFNEWVRLYGVDTRDAATRVEELADTERREAELLAMSPMKYIHFRDRVGEQVLSKMVRYAKEYKGGTEKEDH